MNPPIVAAMPSSQAGWRASRIRSRASKPAVSLSLAPLRWHTEAVAVHTLAAMASRMALSISLPLRLGPPDPAGMPGSRRPPGTRVCLVWLRLRLPRPGPQGPGERTGDGLVAAFFGDQQQPGQVERDTRAAEDGED